MLSEAELAEIRAAVEESFPDTCTIQTRTETNTKGSVADSYANTYTNVPCRLMPVRREAREYEVAGKITMVARFLLTVPHDQAIAATNRVIHGGLTYEVLGVQAGHSFRTARRADLALVA